MIIDGSWFTEDLCDDPYDQVWICMQILSPGAHEFIVKNNMPHNNLQHLENTPVATPRVPNLVKNIFKGISVSIPEYTLHKGLVNIREEEIPDCKYK